MFSEHHLFAKPRQEVGADLGWEPGSDSLPSLPDSLPSLPDSLDSTDTCDFSSRWLVRGEAGAVWRGGGGCYTHGHWDRLKGILRLKKN